MARRTRINSVPTTQDRVLNAWIAQVTEALNVLPALSIVSTSNGPNSAITGASGELAFDVGSSNTTMWLKASGDTTTGWAAVSLAAAPFRENMQLVTLAASSSGTTYSLPAASTSRDTIYSVKKLDAVGTLYVTASGRSVEAETRIGITTQYDSVMLQSDGTDWWII
jgi:hypothetical protein